MPNTWSWQSSTSGWPRSSAGSPIAEGRAQQLERRVQRLHGALSEQYGFGRILGQAPSLREALERAARVAPEETPVLLTGESGTGKELVAQAIHYASRRADGPCVAINCAALPDTLIESELFGHERGAFTGADKQKPGRFELAAGGTLFLDEVGELAASVQAKLLRVLQEHEFQRVGGTATLKADFRLIVATNRNLTDAMAARPVPRRSLLPAQRVSHSPAAAARARRGRGAPRPGVRPPPGRADGQGGAGAEPRRPGAAGDVPVAR